MMPFCCRSQPSMRRSPAEKQIAELRSRLDSLLAGAAALLGEAVTVSS